jgi:hypothetical protein
VLKNGMVDAAATAEEKWQATLDLLGSSLQQTAGGAAAWEQFLGITGGIDEAAMEAYAKVQTFLNDVNQMVAANVPPNMIAGWMKANQGYLNADAGSDLATAMDGWIEKGVAGMGANPNAKSWFNEKLGQWFVGESPVKIPMPEVDTSTMESSMNDLITQYGDINESATGFIEQYITDTSTYEGQVKLRIAAENKYKELYDSYVSKDITITTYHKDVYSGSSGGTQHSTPKPGTGQWSVGPTGQSQWIPAVYFYARGGSFIIPSGYPNDSYPLGPNARGQSGEKVTITPVGQKSAGEGTVINIYGYTGDLKQLAAEVDRRQNIQRLMQ